MPVQYAIRNTQYVIRNNIAGIFLVDLDLECSQVQSSLLFDLTIAKSAFIGIIYSHIKY